VEIGHGYEASVHDMDTSLDELTIMQTDMNAPARKVRVMMNAATWRSLSKTDQEAWDTMSEDGKRKILAYASNRESSSRRPNQGNFRRSANTHEQVATPERVFDESREDTSGKIEASTHETQKSTSPDTVPETSPTTHGYPPD